MGPHGAQVGPTLDSGPRETHVVTYVGPMEGPRGAHVGPLWAPRGAVGPTLGCGSTLAFCGSPLGPTCVHQS